MAVVDHYSCTVLVGKSRERIELTSACRSHPLNNSLGLGVDVGIIGSVSWLDVFRYGWLPRVPLPRMFAVGSFILVHGSDVCSPDLHNILDAWCSETVTRGC